MNLTWWMILYVIVLLLGAIAGAILDLRGRERWWYTGLSLASALAGVLLCLAFASPGLAGRLGVILPLAVLFDMVWTSATVPLEARREFPDSRRLSLLSIGIGLVVFSPAWVFGIVAYLRTLNAEA